MEGQHSDVVHRPNADSHRGGPAGQPQKTGPVTSGRDASGEVEGGVRGDDRDEDGEGDKTVVYTSRPSSALEGGSQHFGPVQVFWTCVDRDVPFRTARSGPPPPGRRIWC